MNIQRAAIFLSLVVVAIHSCNGGEITYIVSQSIGAGSVTGNLVTDGVIGNVQKNDIVGYDLLISDGADTPFEVTSMPPLDVFLTGSDLSATASQLLFNFSGVDDGVFGILYPSGDFGVCFVAGGPGGCFTVLAPSAGAALGYLSPAFVFNTQFSSLSGTQVIGTAAPSIPEPGAGSMTALGLGVVFCSWVIRRFLNLAPRH